MHTIVHYQDYYAIWDVILKLRADGYSAKDVTHHTVPSTATTYINAWDLVCSYLFVVIHLIQNK